MRFCFLPMQFYPRASKYFRSFKIFEQGPERGVDPIGPRLGEAAFQREPPLQSRRTEETLLLLGRSQQIIEQPSFVGTTHGTS